MTTKQKVKRYPVRGALYGLLIGLSAAWFIFFQFAMVPFDTLGSVITKFVLVIVGGIVLGVLWAYLAPPRKAKGEAPQAPATAPAAPEPMTEEVADEMPVASAEGSMDEDEEAGAESESDGAEDDD